MNADPAREDSELRLALANDKESYRLGLRQVSAQLQAWRVGERAAYAVELVFEEIFTNIMRYGFSDPGRHVIHVGLVRQEDAVTVEFEDDGTPFDPTQRENRPPPGLDQDAPPGGRGLIMVRKMSRSLRYEHRGERNWLEVVVEDVRPPGA